MNFNGLIDRYSVEFEIITTAKGEYVGGEYVEGQSTSVKKRGAIVSIPQRKIYQSGGHLTAKDLRLFTYEAVESTKIKYKGCTYSVEESGDYSEFAGVYSYILKWVNGFEHS